MNATDVIKGPLITEKLDAAREKFRQYSFIVDKKATRYAVDLSLAPEMEGWTLDLVNCYIGYLLPLMVEIQHFRRAPEAR